MSAFFVSNILSKLPKIGRHLWIAKMQKNSLRLTKNRKLSLNCQNLENNLLKYFQNLQNFKKKKKKNACNELLLFQNSRNYKKNVSVPQGQTLKKIIRSINIGRRTMFGALVPKFENLC